MSDHTKPRVFELAMDMTFLTVNQELWRRKLTAFSLNTKQPE